MSPRKTKRKRPPQKRVKRSAYELMAEAGLIGCVKGAPKDLSTNKRYFKGFGKDK
jgi:hypothetical protein